jgi:hypothetical protein
MAHLGRSAANRASEDGFKARGFHRLCDGKGPTLVVIKSAAHTFGGFTTASWHSRNQPSAADESFLFSLSCYAGVPPFRMVSGGGKATI